VELAGIEIEEGYIVLGWRVYINIKGREGKVGDGGGRVGWREYSRLGPDVLGLCSGIFGLEPVCFTDRFPFPSRFFLSFLYC
jgi:hypothetical protein